MEGRSVDTHRAVKQSTVAKLAGKFSDQSATAVHKEVPLPKPVRKKPPCSLPLPVVKAELGHNGEEKTAGNALHPQKNKVKSSPIIEKLQGNLMFPPPGRAPKSPGYRVMPSPFNSPPLTPDSPNRRSQSSDSDAVPVGFEQPPEGAALRGYIKLRTKGSLKRRPPSRKFRKSQTDMGDEDFDAMAAPKQNGGKSEDTDEVFEAKRGMSPEPSDRAGDQGVQQTSDDKIPTNNTGGPEKAEKKVTDEAEADKQESGEKKRKQRTEHGTEKDMAHAEVAAENADKPETEENPVKCQEAAGTTETVGEADSKTTAAETATEESSSSQEDSSNQDEGNKTLEDKDV
ncbi:capZ-interacting protein isoform X2 [Lissotriton helveticus]